MEAVAHIFSFFVPALIVGTCRGCDDRPSLASRTKRAFAREWLYARVSLLTTPTIADTTPTTRRRAGTTDELISAASGVGPSQRNVRGAPAITLFATSGLPVRDGGDAGYPRATSTSATTPRGRASEKSRYSDRSGVLFRGRMQIGSLALYYETPP